MSRRWKAFAAGLALAATIGAPAEVPAQAQAPEPPVEVPPDPKEVLSLLLDVVGQLSPPEVVDPLEVLDPLNPACDPLDPSMCLFPFPSDRFTVADPSTPTGRRVDLPLLAMPRSVAGVPVDPTEWNRNDGFSPGSMLLTHVDGLDLAVTFGIADRPERYRDQITDLSLSLAPDAPVVLVDADTGERHPYYAELDNHPETPPAARTLIVRPARNLADGHRYVVGLRQLRRADGTEIPAGPAFAALQDGEGGDRQAHFDAAVFPPLAAAGVERDELFLAWDFTVASTENLTGRVLAMRDLAFAQLGDTDLDDGVVAGTPPAFTVDTVEAAPDGDDSLRVVRGTVEVPNFLNLPAEAAVEVPDVGTFPAPGSRLVYDEVLPGPMATPAVNPLFPTRSVPYVCSVPRTILSDGPAVPLLYGHGLLGSRDESTGGSTRELRQRGYLPCAVDWTGMATGDLLNVGVILVNVSGFPSLADRAQQGFVEFLLLGRALAHPDGFAAHPAFQVAGVPAFDPAGLVFDGNSQGAIMGGALAALGVDFTRANLGVPGMNYSTLLNRSVDWEGVYSSLLYASYPDKAEQQLLLALLQMLWDRGETNGFANHLAADPLPDTPPKQVLLQAGFGDHQVANIAAEVEARTLGAARFPADLPDCRHWSLDQHFGFPIVDQAAQSTAVLSYFDSGTPTPPNTNLAPHDLGEDPHDDPRHAPAAVDQKLHFFETGTVVDFAGGGHAVTHRWPERAGAHLDTVLAQADGSACLDEQPAVARAASGAATAATARGATAQAGTSGGLPATGGPGAGGVAALLAVLALLGRQARRALG